MSPPKQKRKNSFIIIVIIEKAIYNVIATL